MFPFLVAALFVVSLGYGILAPSLPEVAARAGLGPGLALSLAYSTYSFAKISSQLPAGYIADRIGGERVLRFALVTYVVAMSAIAFQVPLALFVASRAAEGMAEGAVYPSVLKLIRENTTPDRMGRRIGMALGMGSSGLLIGPVLGAALASRGIVRVTAVTAAMGLAALAAQTVYATRRPKRVAEMTSPGSESGTRERIAALRRVLLTPKLVRIALPVGFNKLMTSGFFAMFPLIVADRFRGNKMTTAAFFLACGLSFMAAQALGGLLADRYRLRTLLVGYVPLLIASTFALGTATTVWGFGLVLFVQTLLQTCILLACLRELATEEKTKDQFGGVFGAVATATDLFTIPGPPLALFLFNKCNLHTFWVLAGVGLMFYVVRFFIPEREASAHSKESAS